MTSNPPIDGNQFAPDLPHRAPGDTPCEIRSCVRPAEEVLVLRGKYRIRCIQHANELRLQGAEITDLPVDFQPNKAPEPPPPQVVPMPAGKASPFTLCTFPGCHRPHSGRGVCSSHLQQAGERDAKTAHGVDLSKLTPIGPQRGSAEWHAARGSAKTAPPAPEAAGPFAGSLDTPKEPASHTTPARDPARDPFRSALRRALGMGADANDDEIIGEARSLTNTLPDLRTVRADRDKALAAVVRLRVERDEVAAKSAGAASERDSALAQRDEARELYDDANKQRCDLTAALIEAANERDSLRATLQIRTAERDAQERAHNIAAESIELLESDLDEIGKITCAPQGERVRYVRGFVEQLANMERERDDARVQRDAGIRSRDDGIRCLQTELDSIDEAMGWCSPAVAPGWRAQRIGQIKAEAKDLAIRLDKANAQITVDLRPDDTIRMLARSDGFDAGRNLCREENGLSDRDRKVAAKLIGALLVVIEADCADDIAGALRLLLGIE